MNNFYLRYGAELQSMELPHVEAANGEMPNLQDGMDSASA